MSCRLCDNQPEPESDLCGYHAEPIEENDPNLCRKCLAPRGVTIRRRKSNPLRWVPAQQNLKTSDTLERPVKVIIHKDGLCGACHYRAVHEGTRRCHIKGCKFEPLPDRVRCAYHMEDERQRQAARRQAKEQRNECRECTKSRLPGHLYCKIHLEARRVDR